MSIKDAEEEVQRIMQSVDLDNSGFIDYTEFLTATMERDKLLSKSNLETAFEAFDKDGSGSITALELRQMIGGEDQI